MSDQVTQLQLRYGIAARPHTYRLESDARDTDRNRPVNVFPFPVFSWDWTDEEFDLQYRDQEILKVRENGIQHVRLYAPLDLPVQITATELPTSVPKLDPLKYAQFVPSANVQPGEVDPFFRDLVILRPQFLTDARVIGRIQFSPAPPTAERVGTYETVVLDTLEFGNSRVAYLQYSYATAFAVAYASDFVTSDGRSIDPPVFVPGLGGALVTTEPCYGAVVLRYKIPYRLYRINYGLPPTSQMRGAQLAWLRGDINAFPLPPVKVIAISAGAGRVATLDFTKTIYPAGATLASWSSMGFEGVMTGAPTALSESERKSITMKVFNPEDVTNSVPEEERDYLLIKRAKSVKLFDKNGRPYEYHFKRPPQDGSEGVVVSEDT